MFTRQQAGRLSRYKHNLEQFQVLLTNATYMEYWERCQRNTDKERNLSSNKLRKHNVFFYSVVK